MRYTLLKSWTFSKLKDFAVDNFRFDENGRTFSKRVKNDVGKGEIARYEQFLLFPQRFPNTFTPDTSRPWLVWEKVNAFSKKKIYISTNIKPALSAQAYPVRNFLISVNLRMLVLKLPLISRLSAIWIQLNWINAMFKQPVHITFFIFHHFHTISLFRCIEIYVYILPAKS